MIPAEAVEAAAKAIYLVRLNNIVVESDRATMERVAQRDALTALEAAAPHMLADAWDEGSEAGYNDGEGRTNPYRSQP